MDHDIDRPGPVLPALGPPSFVPSSFVVVLGGGPLARHLTEVPSDAVVIAADSGLESALAAGLSVAHVVGDFDSVDPILLADAIAGGVEAHHHPADKDATDSELAFRLVRRMADAGASVQVFATAVGRFDHLLADVLALAGPTLTDLVVTGFVGDVVVTVVRPGSPRTVTGRVGEQVSLIPVNGPAGEVSTEGLRWPLVAARLAPGTSRGVSNELSADKATVAVGEGALVVVQPGTTAPEVASRSTSYDSSPQ